MKNLFALLIFIVLIQGCTNHQVQSKNETRKSTHENIMKNMGKAPEQVKFGSSCEYRNNRTSGSCAANQELVGSICSCMTNDGLQNGAIR